MAGAVLFCVGMNGHIYGEQSTMDKVMVLETNQGTIEIKLMPEVAPKACENFIQLAEKKYYDGLIFHRVIKQFMIQGGDPRGNGTGGESVWGKPFEDEVSPSVQFDAPGILAMANSGPGTNGSQFFITTIKTPWLNGKHTIFGKVVFGYDVVQKIENTAVDGSDKPLSDQKLVRAYLKAASWEQPSQSAQPVATQVPEIKQETKQEIKKGSNFSPGNVSKSKHK